MRERRFPRPESGSERTRAGQVYPVLPAGSGKLKLASAPPVVLGHHRCAAQFLSASVKRLTKRLVRVAPHFSKAPLAKPLMDLARGRDFHEADGLFHLSPGAEEADQLVGGRKSLTAGSLSRDEIAPLGDRRGSAEPGRELRHRPKQRLCTGIGDTPTFEPECDQRSGEFFQFLRSKDASRRDKHIDSMSRGHASTVPTGRTHASRGSDGASETTCPHGWYVNCMPPPRSLRAERSHPKRRYSSKPAKSRPHARPNVTRNTSN